MKSAKAIVAVTLAAAAFLACDESPVEQNGDAQLTLSPDSVVVGVYESSPLTATVRDGSGAIQYVSPQYVSRDQSVADRECQRRDQRRGGRLDVCRRYALGPPGRA